MKYNFNWKNIRIRNSRRKKWKVESRKEENEKVESRKVENEKVEKKKMKMMITIIIMKIKMMMKQWIKTKRKKK